MTASCRHGICATRLELDDARLLAQHPEPLLADWSPEADDERRLVHDLAVTALKLARLDTLELKALDAAIAAADVRYPALASLAGYRHVLRREREATASRLSAVQGDRWAEEDAAAEAEAAAARARVSEPERRGASVHVTRYH